MINKILLNNEPISISENSLPCLISYSEKTGGSHFSLSYIANLFAAGSKILFLTAHPMAVENFIEQVKEVSQDFMYIESKSEVIQSKIARAILVKSGDEKLFIELLNSLKDINERIIFIKNIESFSEGTINKCLGLNNIILSGDIDKCESKNEILKSSFATTVFFTQPRSNIDFELPDLERYSGYMRSNNREGAIKIDINK